MPCFEVKPADGISKGTVLACSIDTNPTTSTCCRQASYWYQLRCSESGDKDQDVPRIWVISKAKRLVGTGPTVTTVALGGKRGRERPTGKASFRDHAGGHPEGFSLH